VSWSGRGERRRVGGWYWDFDRPGGDSILVHSGIGDSVTVAEFEADEAGMAKADALITDLNAGRISEKVLKQRSAS
jgi:hypothetical protein